MSTEETKSENAPTREEQIAALNRYLHRRDREEVMAQYRISKPTYYRVIRELDLSNPVLVDLLKRAAANKQSQEDAQATLNKLV